MNPSILITPNSGEAGKLFSIIPTDGAGDLNVVRNTTATYVDADGLIKTALANEVRFDYSNGSCPSILVEPQRTNLIFASEDFTSYTKNATTIIENCIVSPDGNFTGSKIYPNSSGNARGLQKNINITLNTHTLSIFAKHDGGTIEILTFTRGAAPDISFNIKLGQVVGTIPSGMTADIIPYKDGWYRCDVYYGSTNTDTRFYITLSNSPNSFSVTANGTNGLFLWGAQVEQGSNATSYIPTVASTVTRNADVVSKSGISDLIGQTEGTIFLDASSFNLLGTGAGERVSLTNGTFNFRVNIDIQSNGLVQLVASNATTGLNGTISSTSILILPNTRFKIAAAYNGSNSCLYVNGVAFTTIVGNIPTFNGELSKVEFNQGNGARPFFGRVNNLIVYPNRLSNSQLQQLTTL